MDYFPILLRIIIPIDSYFSGGFKPPTRWYRSSFLSGDLSSEADPCRDKFDAYRGCVLKELREQGVDKIAQFEYNATPEQRDFDA